VTSFSQARRRGFTRELVIAECEFVSVVWKRSLPDPDEPSRTWEAFGFDTFRIRDGRLSEHWDESTR
jgi:predicted SnoaL-like aldol condensation-catalyzing enzyme